MVFRGEVEIEELEEKTELGSGECRPVRQKKE